MCLEATIPSSETRFGRDEVVLGVVLAKSDNQTSAVPVGTVALTRVNSTTVRGMWVAQHLSRYTNGNDKTEYLFGIIGSSVSREENTKQLNVGPPTTGASGEIDISKCQQARDFAMVLECLGDLNLFGNTSIQEGMTRLWEIYGSEYPTMHTFAVEFTKGAFGGEWGVQRDDHGHGVAYFVGWIIIGFVPIVDVPADVRDALYSLYRLAVPKCSSGFFPLPWEDFKCKFTMGITNLTNVFIDGVAIIPAVGKIADVPQAARAVDRFIKTGGNPEKVSDLNRAGRIYQGLRRSLRECWAMSNFQRGICLQGELHQRVYRDWTDLDANIDHMPVVDYYRLSDRATNTHTVVSLKTMNLDSVRYQTQSGIGNRARKYKNDLRDGESKFKPALQRRSDYIGTIPDMPVPYFGKRMDIVVNKVPSTDQGRGLHRVMCEAQDERIPVRIIIALAEDDAEFVEWGENKRIKESGFCDRLR